MLNRWLTIEKDKETGKYIRFAHQGFKDKTPKETVQELIEKWNSNPEMKTTWTLIEDETIEQLAQDVEYSMSWVHIFNTISSLNQDVQDLSSTLQNTLDFVEEQCKIEEEKETNNASN